MRIRAIFVPLVLVTASCSIREPRYPTPTVTTANESTAAAKRGQTFAEAHCAGCHAIKSGLSSNPQAPSFEAVINTPGLEAATLRPWLRNSHNFPAMMNFAIDPDQIEDLAAYMLTLKDPGYRPAIQ